jgi:hypothetical protein
MEQTAPQRARVVSRGHLAKMQPGQFGQLSWRPTLYSPSTHPNSRHSIDRERASTQASTGLASTGNARVSSQVSEEDVATTIPPPHRPMHCMDRAFLPTFNQRTVQGSGAGRGALLRASCQPEPAGAKRMKQHGPTVQSCSIDDLQGTCLWPYIPEALSCRRQAPYASQRPDIRVHDGKGEARDDKTTV